MELNRNKKDNIFIKHYKVNKYVRNEIWKKKGKLIKLIKLNIKEENRLKIIMKIIRIFKNKEINFTLTK